MGIALGLVGVGGFGAGFAALFKRHPLVDRFAVCDLDPARLAAAAREHGVTETYASLDDACRGDLDALAIITQPWLHAPQVVQVMESGKHVYSAVPMAYEADGARGLEWIDRIVATSRRTGQLYMMGETSHYRPEAMYCRRRAAAGDFGRFAHAEGIYFHDADLPSCSLREVVKARWGARYTERKGGGIPLHYPTHSLGGFLSVMRTRVTAVAAFGFHDPDDDWHTADREESNVYGNETALLKLANGATAEIKEYRRVGAPGHEGFSLYGTRGSFVDSFGRTRWVGWEREEDLTPEAMRDPLPPDVAAAWQDAHGETMYGGHGGSHAYLVHEFVSAVAAGRQPAVNAWQAARYLAPGIVAHQSVLQGGALLPVPDWGEAP